MKNLPRPRRLDHLVRHNGFDVTIFPYTFDLMLRTDQERLQSMIDYLRRIYAYVEATRGEPPVTSAIGVVS